VGNLYANGRFEQLINKNPKIKNEEKKSEKNLESELCKFMCSYDVLFFTSACGRSEEER
jgi:hypothetical protein